MTYETTTIACYKTCARAKCKMAVKTDFPYTLPSHHARPWLTSSEGTIGMSSEVIPPGKPASIRFVRPVCIHICAGKARMYTRAQSKHELATWVGLHLI